MGVFADVPLIVDTSALVVWRRAPDPVRQLFAQAPRAGELRMHPVVRLEFLHDAWDQDAFDIRDRTFSAFPEIGLDSTDGLAAIQAMRDLRHRSPVLRGYHKVKAGDALGMTMP